MTKLRASREDMSAIMRKRSGVGRGTHAADCDVCDHAPTLDWARALGLDVEDAGGGASRISFPATGDAVTDEAGRCLLSRNTLMELRFSRIQGVPCVLWADDHRLATMLCPIGERCREVARGLIDRMDAYARETYGGLPVGAEGLDGPAAPVEVVEEVPVEVYGDAPVTEEVHEEVPLDAYGF